MIPGVAMCCGIGCRCSSDPVLLWLRCRLAAITPIQHLAWELPYATSAALKAMKRKEKKGKGRKKREEKERKEKKRKERKWFLDELQ